VHLSGVERDDLAVGPPHEEAAGTIDPRSDALAWLRLGRPVRVAGHGAVYARTYADVAPGDLLLYEDASRSLAVAVNSGDAAARLGVRAGDEVPLVPA